VDEGVKYEGCLDAPPSLLDASIHLFHGAEQNSWSACKTDEDGDEDVGSYKLSSKCDGHRNSMGRP